VDVQEEVFTSQGGRVAADRTYILLVEDSVSLSETYRAYLTPLGAQIATAGSLAEARDILSHYHTDVILLDLRLPDGDGLSLLKELPQGETRPRVVVMTAHGSVQVAVEAMRAGAADFLVKPFEGERLRTTVANALEAQRLTRLVRRYEDSFRHEGYCGFIGRSLAMQAVYRMIESAAPSKASVFITGESGTGKELAVEALHARSPRSGSPLVAINCAALPKDLIESELFGHRKGAFTGATANRTGAAVRADGGTLFLDEICEMDMALQGKLLRFVQSGLVQPVGSDEVRRVDVRLVCASNRNPLEEVQAGGFREDLFYRLHVIPIDLPPLRDRGEDVAELAEIYLQRLAQQEGKGFRKLSPEARSRLLAHSWPGNVRELINVLQTAVVLNDGEVLEDSMLPAHLSAQSDASCRAGFNEGPHTDFTPLSPGGLGVQPLRVVERQAIERALAATEGNVARAAALLEIAPSTLYRRLQSDSRRQTDTPDSTQSSGSSS